MTGCKERMQFVSSALVALLLLAAWGCSRGSEAAPTKTQVTLDPNVYQTDRPELFKIAKVETQQLPSTLTANGTVTPDVNRTIHVTSLGGGRVSDLRVRLGEQVKKGQVLLVISSPDLALAFSDYQKAVADERLSKRALDRAQLLFDKGAIAEKDFQLAEDTEEKARVDVQTTAQRVKVLGGDPAHPSPLLELRAPVAGTIVEQNVAGFEGVKSLDNTPNLFTIADLSQVWVVCDVFENDLGNVHLGDAAQIQLNAYPDRVFQGKVADISRVLDPNTRAAKVRIILANSDGQLRPGMFAVATFRSKKLTPALVVPSTAVIRLHDKDWVFVQEGPKQFRRQEVVAGSGLSDGLEQIRSGVSADQQVVANALDFSTAVAEKQ
jgi:cobalt-zinc-cadmium efflux system membrane fusion protein